VAPEIAVFEFAPFVLVYVCLQFVEFADANNGSERERGEMVPSMLLPMKHGNSIFEYRNIKHAN
jgi:hypothetical protein